MPGYGLPAKAVLEAMGKTGDLIDFDQAYKNDSLLYSRSVRWSVSQLELSLLGTFGVFSGGSGFTS